VNKKPQTLTIVFFLALVIAVLAGVNISSINNSLTNTDECRLMNNSCHFSVESGELIMEFDQSPMIEEEMLLNIIFPSGFTLANAWIEGVNMYMGKTPVILESKGDGQVQGITFLGSCTQPKMEWVMKLNVKNEKTEQTRVYSVLFTTKTE
jgi:hypothetical protein